VGDRKQSRAEAKQSRDSLPSTSTWEWSVAAAGMLLVTLVLAYLGYFALTSGPAAPAVSVEHSPPVSTDGNYLVRFRARNSAGGTAAQLKIRAELRDGPTLREDKDIVLDYLPGFSTRTGTFVFRTDPAGLTLTVTAESFTEP
jgi:uncharacterized protein (TIGR02588 family)